MWGHVVLTADVSSRKERILNEARKVVDNVNAMSFVNLDDQQVHSLMMMREIARGILCNRVEKVREKKPRLRFYFVILLNCSSSDGFSLLVLLMFFHRLPRVM